MNGIIHILDLLFDFTLLGGAILFIKKFIDYRKNLSMKNEIQNLNAKISMLRMALKVKVKKKVNAIKSRFVNPINQGDAFDIALTNLLDNKFETNDDFQNYFDISKRITSSIEVEMKSHVKSKNSNNNKNKAVEEIVTFEEIMGPDYKNEIAIIRTIKDMADSCKKLNEKAEIFNKNNPKEQVAKVDFVIFKSLHEVNRLFSEEPEKLNEILNEDKSKNAA